VAERFSRHGIVADYKVARFFNDCEALYTYEGTFQMQNLIVGKAITGSAPFCRLRRNFGNPNDLEPDRNL